MLDECCTSSPLIQHVERWSRLFTYLEELGLMPTRRCGLNHNDPSHT